MHIKYKIFAGTNKNRPQRETNKLGGDKLGKF